MSFFEDAAPSILLFSIQCLTILVILFTIYLVRRRRASRSSDVLPVYQDNTFDEKTIATSEVSAIETNEKSAEWLPPNHFDGDNWVAKIAREAEKSTAELHPVLKEFQATIENDPILFMLFTRMFQEVPEARDPTGRKEVHSYQHMLRAFNIVLAMGPPWAYTTAGQKGINPTQFPK